MRAPAAVGVDDDFAPGEAGVALGSADYEEPGRLDLGVVIRWWMSLWLCLGNMGGGGGRWGKVYMVDGSFVEIFGWDHFLDDLFEDFFS